MYLQTIIYFLLILIIVLWIALLIVANKPLRTALYCITPVWALLVIAVFVFFTNIPIVEFVDGSI